MSITAPTVQPETGQPSPRRALGGLLRSREMPVLLALVILVGVTYIANPLFLNSQGVKDLLLNSTIMIILAVGQTLLIITRNIDLSVGSILGLVAFMTGTLFATYPSIPIPVVFLAGMAFGALLGAVNGMLVTAAKVPALVITLGTLYIYRGLNNAWAGGTQYFADDRPDAFGNLSVDTILGFPVITLVAILVVIVMAVYTLSTRPGRDLYAIGSDPDAARLFGIPVGSPGVPGLRDQRPARRTGGGPLREPVQLRGGHDGHGHRAGRGGRRRGRWRGHLRRKRLGDRRRPRRGAADHDHQRPDRHAGGQVLAAGDRRRPDPRRDHHRPGRKPANGQATATE